MLAAIAIMMIALLGGEAVSGILPCDNASVKNLVSSVVYIGLTLSAGLLYAKYVLHFSFEEIGARLKMPQITWIIASLLLPLAITAFYLIFKDGRIVKNDNAESISFYLIYAIFPAGLASGICEEFIFRGLIMRTFERRWQALLSE